MDVLQWSRHYRCFPGQGGFDLTTFLGHMLATGYRGPLSLEVFNDVFRQADAKRTAVDAMRSLLVLEESLRTSIAAEAALIDLDLCMPPAPVEPAGFAFAEIAVDHRSARAVEQVLTTLGFARSGYHRSKPVHLWTQARARVLLNHGDTRVAGDLQGDALVSALALEVDDPEQAAERADQLCAPRIARDYGPSEADLSAVAAPDGSAIFFCRTAASDAQSWVTDFLPGEPPAPPVPAGITAHRPRGDNYYDDLAARTDLDDALIANMRANAVLHDHTERGAFLHFYTPLIGRRLFFEVVQRSMPTTGYGAPNTPVRMAALRAAVRALDRGVTRA